MGNACSCGGNREDNNDIQISCSAEHQKKREGSFSDLSESSNSSPRSSRSGQDLTSSAFQPPRTGVLLPGADEDMRSQFEIDRQQYITSGFVYLPFEVKPGSETVPMIKYLLTKKAMLILKDQALDFVVLLQALQQGFVGISQRIQRRHLFNNSIIASTLTSSQPEGEAKPLFILPAITQDCCEIIEENLKDTGLCCAIYCTRKDKLLLGDDCINNNNTSSTTKYVVMFTGLDNDIDPENNSGSTFTIFRRVTTKFRPISEKEDLLQACSNAIASGYCFYGSAITIILTIGTEVNGFTYDPIQREFVMTHPKIKAAQRATQISIDTSRESLWEPHIGIYLNRRLQRKERRMHVRYVGSLVADAHRTLLYGGIFMSPLNAKTSEGDVSVIDAFVLANIFEKSWGRASQGEAGSIIQMKMVSLKQRIQFYCGSSAEVVELENIYLSIARRQSINKSVLSKFSSNQSLNNSIDLTCKSLTN